MRHDFAAKQKLIAKDFGADSFDALLRSWYLNESMSSHEIAERIANSSEFKITPRTIQRKLNKLGLTRTVGDAFRLAVKRGRVEWHLKSNKIKRKKIAKALRYAILRRDGFRCVLCGADAAQTMLEVDHIVPVAEGGANGSANLRTLCHECNVGRHQAERVEL